MNVRATTLRLSALLLAVAGSSCARAQAVPTASQTFRLSVFGGGTGTFTGLDSGRNLGITAGVDLGFGSYFGFQPTAEVRGTYPVDDGTVDEQRNVLGGVKLARRYGPFHPYLNLLYGRGEIKYLNGIDDPSGTVKYFQTTSNITSFGGGLDVDLTRRFGAKADAQFQRYGTPVTASGNLFAKSLTLGVVYRFSFGGLGGH